MKYIVSLIAFPAVLVQMGMYRLMGVPATCRLGDVAARPVNSVTRNQEFMSRIVPVGAITGLVLLLRWYQLV